MFGKYINVVASRELVNSERMCVATTDAYKRSCPHRHVFLIATSSQTAINVIIGNSVQKAACLFVYVA